jgi:hypothetical protein
VVRAGGWLNGRARHSPLWTQQASTRGNTKLTKHTKKNTHGEDNRAVVSWVSLAFSLQGR